ncbi:TlpA disulfide reductase family protein [Algoriphagus persicinus]|uniref:TlpA disulfide reductase family protein n=1 Tax=Algoriphagus persicinus TaxID=3108754 RepID=UPI002B3DAB53|nr:TlpA disulfide reductase family protein [Algoriphagus sp. E1-3-M2]MEB2785499.1 TlpA disulfide reductase family protein [Algoriphagus sp. E1-3-M2]
MKKLILICLLGLLCLPTSTTTAKVADSPGADFLHRSRPIVSFGLGDTHRGGDTRSDTLSIGDLIPAGIEFSEVLHLDTDKLRLDDYRGKYVILEFWAPTCSLSSGSLATMEELQNHYGDRLAILPMTIFPESRVQEVLSAYSVLQNLDIPIVVNAQKMREYFPHLLLPHFVILDPEGRVAAITSQSDITIQNLDKMLAGDEGVFREKKDKRINLDRNARLISESPQVENKNIWFQSAMTGYIPGLGGSIIQDYAGLSQIRIVNMSILSHFQLAYSERDLVDYYGRNRIETPGFGPEELFAEKVGQDALDWMEEGTHVFGYELIAPPHLNPYKLMREDLKRFFPQVKASVERKSRTVYALVQLEGQHFPKARTGKQAYQANGNGVRMRNYPLQGFVYHLNSSFQQNNPYPIVNHTGIDYPIDLSMDAKLSNVESLRSALRMNGLDLVKQEEVIAVLVLEKAGDFNLLAP